MIPPDAQMMSVPTKPRDTKFLCEDCGKQRLGNLRTQCRICGAFICDYCEVNHPKQHPKERWL